MVAEAERLRGQGAALAKYFPVREGCQPETDCDLMVLARDPKLQVSLSEIGVSKTRRIARVDATLPDGRRLTVLGMHLVKPWFETYSNIDEWFALDQISRTTGPLAVLGDFNAAPWSRRGDMLMRRCGLDVLRRPVASWPVAAGWAGVPIDNLFLRGGARAISAAPWGGGLQSNHRGLIVHLGLSNSPEEIPDRDKCRRTKPPW